MTLHFDDLAIFARVATSGSFSRGARALGLSLSTVSRRVAALEDELGVRLIQRTTRRFVLTAVGGELAQRCVAMVAEGAAARRLAEQARHPLAGTLRVTTTPVVGAAYLPSILREMARSYPSIKIEAELDGRVRDLVAGRFDVALRVGALPSSSLVARRIGSIEAVLCSSPDYLRRRGAPTTPAELERHDCVVVRSSRRPSAWQFVDAGAIRIDARISVNCFILARELALAGLGIVLLPRVLADPSLRDGTLHAVLADLALARPSVHAVLADLALARPSVHAVFPSRRQLPPRVKAFVEIAARTLSASRT